MVTKIIKIKSLCIFFPETNAYRIYFDGTECMSVLMKDKEFLEKYNEIWEKVSNKIINKKTKQWTYF